MIPPPQPPSPLSSITACTVKSPPFPQTGSNLSSVSRQILQTVRSTSKVHQIGCPPKCAGSMSRRLSCRFSSKRGWQCFSQEFWQFSLSLARLHASLSLFRHLMPGHHTLARNRLCSVPAHPPLTCALHTSLPHRFSIKSRFLLQYPSTRSCN